MSAYTTHLFTAGGAESVVGVRFVVATAFALSATDYWTMTVRLRRAGQSNGELVATRTTQAVNLVVATPMTLYPDPAALTTVRTFPMKPGESLWATRVSTGSPGVLDGPTWEVDLKGVLS